MARSHGTPSGARSSRRTRRSAPPTCIYALSPGGVDRDGRAHGRMAARDRARGGASRRRPRPPGGAGLPRERWPTRRDRRRDPGGRRRAWARSCHRPRPTCSGMEVDLPLLDQAHQADREGRVRWRWRQGARSSRASGARIDQRFDPEAALEGSARYLEIADERFDGATDLATVSYHMGIGNLESVIDRLRGRRGRPLLRPALLRLGARPTTPSAHDILAGFADDSSLYLLADPGLRERDAPMARRTATRSSAGPS